MTTVQRVPDISYHPYLALLAFHDESEAIQIGSTGGRTVVKSTIEEFAIECDRYSSDLKLNESNYFRANKSFHSQSLLNAYLYNPVFYTCFGEADAISLVLIDDTDPMFKVTANLRSIAQTSLAFCPNINSLGLSTEDMGALSELHLLLGKPDDILASELSSQDRSRNDQLASHSFQERMPLAVITRYKLEGIATIGHGLRIQQALFRTIARRISQCLIELRKCVGIKINHSNELFSIDDLSNFKCVLLDSQGTADVITFMACSNYSVALAVVEAIRRITFGDLFESDTSLKELKQHRKLYDAVSSIASMIHPPLGVSNGERDNNYKIESTDIFASTYSSLGASLDAFNNPERCKGFVEAHGNIGIKPGQLLAVERTLVRLAVQLGNSRTRTLKYNLNSKCHRFMVGRQDYSFSPLETGSAAHEPMELIALRDVIVACAMLLQQNQKATEAQTGAVLRSITTTLVVPIPRINSFDRCRRDRIPMEQVIQHVGQDFFGQKSNARKQTKSDIGKFNKNDLLVSLRRLEIPRRLRHTISYLFQNFELCLSDSHLFANVLDMYDPFATLYTAITEANSDHISCRKTNQSRRYLTSKITNNLARILLALDNALAHRVTMARPYLELRDMAVDFKGGLNQFVAAVDSVLKCSLGLLKQKLKYQRMNDQTVIEGRRDQIGAVTMLTLNPRKACWEIHLRSKPSWNHCLAVMDMNIGHIFHPTELVHYLHECSHLLHRFVEGPTVEHYHFIDASKKQRMLGRDPMHERIEEVYAGFVTLLFAFGADTSLYLKHHISSFNSDPASLGRSEVETVERFTEVLIRCFLVIDPVFLANQTQEHSPWAQCSECTDTDSCYEESILKQTDIESAVNRFLKMVDIFGVYYSEFNSLWCGAKATNIREYTVSMFKEIFPTTFGFANAEWRRVKRFHSQFLSDPETRLPWAIEQVTNGQGKYNEIIRHRLQAGTPLLEDLFADELKQFDKQDPRPESFFGVFEVLRSYIGLLFDEISPDKRLHLERDADGLVTYSCSTTAESNRWSAFQLDPAGPGMFCADPEKRKQRVTWEVATMKALWDISSDLRARRFLDIVYSCWPELK